MFSPEPTVSGEADLVIPRFAFRTTSVSSLSEFGADALLGSASCAAVMVAVFESSFAAVGAVAGLTFTVIMYVTAEPTARSDVCVQTIVVVPVQSPALAPPNDTNVTPA